MSDGQTHTLELYFLDWDNDRRSESVTLSDADTGTVLDTETVSSFQSGVYLDWSVSGNILITIRSLSSANAVLSGLFFDQPRASATFIQPDPATEGTWIGTYGADGYDVINSTANIPIYATVTPPGQSSYTWATTTTDPLCAPDRRRLQPHRVFLVCEHKLYGGCQPVRWTDARAGALFPRLEQHAPERKRDLEQRRHRDGASNRDRLVV